MVILQKKRDWFIFGLILQIPTLVLIITLFFMYGIPFFVVNVSSIYLIIGITIFALSNIFSIIFFIAGLFVQDKKQKGEHY